LKVAGSPAYSVRARNGYYAVADPSREVTPQTLLNHPGRQAFGVQVTTEFSWASEIGLPQFGHLMGCSRRPGQRAGFLVRQSVQFDAPHIGDHSCES